MPYLLIIIFIWFFLGYVVNAIAFTLVAPLVIAFYLIPPFTWVREYLDRLVTLLWYMMNSNGSLFSFENRMDGLWKYGASRKYRCDNETWMREGYWAAKKFYDITGHCPSFWEAQK